MRYMYNVRKDILDADKERYTVYGIDVIHNSDVVKSVSDLFCNREDAESFAKFCDSENIPPERVEDAAANILDSAKRNFNFYGI